MKENLSTVYLPSNINYTRSSTIKVNIRGVIFKLIIIFEKMSSSSVWQCFRFCHALSTVYEGQILWPSTYSFRGSKHTFCTQMIVVVRGKLNVPCIYFTIFKTIEIEGVSSLYWLSNIIPIPTMCVYKIMIWIKRVVVAEGRLCCNDERGSPRKKMHASITIIFRTSLKFKMAVSSASSWIYQQLYNYYLLSKSNSKFLDVWLAGRNACAAFEHLLYTYFVLNFTF